MTTPDPKPLTDDEIAGLERMERESAENHGPTWEASFFHETPEGLDVWWLHTPFVGDADRGGSSCSLIAAEMWEDTARFLAAARNHLPSLLAELRRLRASPPPRDTGRTSWRCFCGAWNASPCGTCGRGPDERYASGAELDALFAPPSSPSAADPAASSRGGAGEGAP